MAVVEVFADIACPFAHVTLRRLVDHRRDLGRSDPVLRVRAWPLELVNGAPHDADSTAAEVAALRATVAPDLFADFEPRAHPASTLALLSLERAAFSVDDRVGERAALALREAVFAGRAGAGAAELAGGLGLPWPREDVAAIEADWRAGQARGVEGSPHCIVGTRSWFCPLFDVDEVDGGFVVTETPARRAEFLAACFAE